MQTSYALLLRQSDFETPEQYVSLSSGVRPSPKTGGLVGVTTVGAPVGAPVVTTGDEVGAETGDSVMADETSHSPFLLLPVHVHSAFRPQRIALRSYPHAA